MKIATFNIWNKEIEWEKRIHVICSEIKRVDPDIIALQEVRTSINSESNMNVAQYISEELGSFHCIFKEYPDSPDEGLAFLSKFPITLTDMIWNTDTHESNYCAIRMTFRHADVDYGITNVHLNWRTAEIRQEQIMTVHQWIFDNQKSYEILCGDFNDVPDSNAHRYLIDNDWTDVALNNEKNGFDAQPTLDYYTNTYLKSEEISRKPLRYDWILLKNKTGSKSLQIESVEIFGDKLLDQYTVLPSDHYGVLARVN
ncbi:endonuclease/exonuclease/phosphatase family protein [Exiguobacterium sp. ERU656]|uniref:endonuclease/exonuclease/phosphatase family protein n=1 Tax=Exiguobacterium sp. ERU656 TaxID=2751217 RepID=UPI001BE8E58D|nr:endonuclease/exonuclease/phosphatase family protein [Exiguobacterium sp. ERU656]